MVYRWQGLYVCYSWLYLPFAAVVIFSLTTLIELTESLIEFLVTAVELVFIVTLPACNSKFYTISYFQEQCMGSNMTS